MQLKTLQNEHPLHPIVREWLANIERACEDKMERFQKYADEAEQFFDSDHNFMWSEKYQTDESGGYLSKDGGTILPKFRMAVNRIFEMVALMGPAMYHENPAVQVTPLQRPQIPPEAMGIDPNILMALSDPMAAQMIPPQMMMDPQFMQQVQMAQQFMQLSQQEASDRAQQLACAQVKQHYINWLQHEADKKSHCRRAVGEAIITGMSFLWTELYNPPGSTIKHPISRYLSCRDVVFDPDARYFEDMKWIARKVIQPVWEAERKFGYAPGTLKGTLRSIKSQSTERSKKKSEKKSKVDGKSFDLIVYWEVYSKCGFGDRLKDMDPEIVGNFDSLGDYCYLAVSQDVPHPLNLPSDYVHQTLMMAEQAITPEETQAQEQDLFMRVQWPIPFWTDGGWPFARLFFYDKPESIYPVSPVKPVISYLRFINWGMSFLADKAAASSDTIIGVVKSAAKDLFEGLSKQHGPFKIVEVSELHNAKSVNDLISFLQAPSFDIALFNMIEKVNEWFDKGSGLTELVYGMSGTQMRSATEADVRQANTSIRPEDMASQVENWLSEAAVKEIEVAVWVCGPEDVAPVLGPAGTMFWQQYIMTQPFDQIVRDYVYRVEAGSARKPNKGNRIRQLNEFGQMAMPTIQAFALQGMVGPWNAYMTDAAKANDLDPTPYLVQPPPPPPMPQETESSNNSQGTPANAS